MERKSVLAATAVIFLSAVTLRAQAPSTPWRGAGAVPCTGPDGGVYQCPPPSRAIALRAGRLFDSKTGTDADQACGAYLRASESPRPERKLHVKIPAGVAGDRSQPGHGPAGPDRHAHAHVQQPRGPGVTTERAMLIAIQNASGRSECGLHRCARHELARQRLRRRRHSQRRQSG